jgi:hypothetical protein
MKNDKRLHCKGWIRSERNGPSRAERWGRHFAPDADFRKAPGFTASFVRSFGSRYGCTAELFCICTAQAEPMAGDTFRSWAGATRVSSLDLQGCRIRLRRFFWPSQARFR